VSQHQEEPRQEFYQTVNEKARRKKRARQHRERSLWTSLGVMGVVGWTVAIPTLLGVLLGLWLDANWPSSFSWTLTLLVGGLFIGCLAAWQWVSQEMDKINRDKAQQREQNND
jgi:ATP synthase protein I